MSIYIKGMEMPTSCMLCNFCVPEADEANGEMCMVTGKLMPPCNRERLDNCPLVPVPPHGDLIDRKALLADTTDMLHSMMVFGGARVYTSDAIKNAPTIIPAEEGE